MERLSGVNPATPIYGNPDQNWIDWLMGRIDGRMEGKERLLTLFCFKLFIIQFETPVQKCFFLLFKLAFFYNKILKLEKLLPFWFISYILRRTGNSCK